MHEQLSEQRLDELNKNLAGINRKLGNHWFAFGKGLLYGLGSVIGAGLALILIGWFLNVIGVIPALKNSSEEWRAVIQQTQDAKNFVTTPSDTTTTTTTTTPAQ